MLYILLLQVFAAEALFNLATIDDSICQETLFRAGAPRLIEMLRTSNSQKFCNKPLRMLVYIGKDMKIWL